MSYGFPIKSGGVESEEVKCPKCGAPSRKGGRYCKSCHAAAMKGYRAQQKMCQWTYSESRCLWETACGNNFLHNTFRFPKAQLNFCPSCGKKIMKEIPE
jgi:ribosomal protein L32